MNVGDQKGHSAAGLDAGHKLDTEGGGDNVEMVEKGKTVQIYPP